MQPTTKGALAAAAAACLLLGSAGSLAYWSGGAVADVGGFSSGKLGITAVGCDAAWTYASGSAKGAAVTTVVPGDAITKNCVFTVSAQGDHLRATPTVPAAVPVTVTGASTPTTLSLPVAATYDVNGTAVTTGGSLTQANDGQKLTAHLTVRFPYGTPTLNGNDTQRLAAKLSTLTVSLAQQKYDANPEG